MYERLRDEQRANTLVIANGVGMGFGGQAAYQAWLRGHEPAKAGTDAIARQEATLMRLRGMFAGTPGFANAIHH